MNLSRVADMVARHHGVRTLCAFRRDGGRSCQWHHLTILALPLLLVRFCAMPVSAQQAQFIPFGFGIGAEGISADGSVIAGATPYPSIEAVRWTNSTGAVGLGLLAGGTVSAASGISRDGNVIVGLADSAGPLVWEAVIWTPSGGLLSLGALPGATKSGAYTVSLDGTVLAGHCTFPSYSQAFRWTAVTGIVGLGSLPGQPVYSDARAINGDGSVIVGVGNVFGVQHGYRWTAQTGMVSLGLLPGYTSAGAGDVSADGNTVVGQACGSSACEGFKWTAAGGLIGLGDLPGGEFQSSAQGVSDSGLVIVGFGRTTLGLEAVFWTPQQGPIRLSSHLTSLGVTAHAGWRLTFAEAVSADGLHIIGKGIDPLGQERSWLAILPEPWTAYCTAKLNSLGCTPTITAAGVPSASNAWSFDVRVAMVLNQKAGLFFYRVGGNPTALPFQGGTLCVGPSGIRRTPGISSGGNPAPQQDCSGAFALDFNAFAAGLSGGSPDPALKVAGSIYRCQSWGRDPGFAPPNNTSLSNALEVPIGP